MRQRSQGRAALDGAELEYEVHGTGEPVMLIHPGVCAPRSGSAAHGMGAMGAAWES